MKSLKWAVSMMLWRLGVKMLSGGKDCFRYAVLQRRKHDRRVGYKPGAKYIKHQTSSWNSGRIILITVFDQYSSVNFGIANKDSYMEGNGRSNAISGIPLTLVLIFDIKIRPACLLGTYTSISRKHLSTTRTDSQQPRAKIRPTCQFVYAILTNG